MRLENIVLTGLIYDRLLIYDKIERIMNSNDSSMYPSDETKSEAIREQLADLMEKNGMIAEWQKIIDPEGDVKKNEHG